MQRFHLGKAQQFSAGAERTSESTWKEKTRIGVSHIAYKRIRPTLCFLRSYASSRF
jgi:hypothetical protein